MHGLLVGTAGHVDHGKTALLLALTGIDCDRLPEEKRRGITLDLGFAHLERDGVELGFVDVPGHERFLHNALAGLGGVRLLLLVVAADEGVRPQTREHLAVAELLGIPELIVALTKIDLVDDELAELVELEIGELLAPTRWAGAPLFRVSSLSGVGLDALTAELLRCARDAAPLAAADDPVRLPIDRAFTPRGQGVVVTGTLVSGCVRPGDELTLQPQGVRVRVRALQTHGRERDEVRAGSRVALRLGGVALDSIQRGEELVADDGARPTSTLLARLRWLAEAPIPLDRPLEARLHLYASERPVRIRPLSPATIAPGAEGLVVIRTRTPLVAARGDRFVVRRLSPAATLGGGEILDPRWRRPRRPALAAELAALAGELESALLVWADRGGVAGTTADELAARLGRAVGWLRPRLDALVSEGRLVPLAGRLFAPQRLIALEKRARQLLADYFARERLTDAMPKAELARRLLGVVPSAVADAHFSWLAERGALRIAGDRVAAPGRSAELSTVESGLAAAIVAEYERAGLEPPSPQETARRLDAKPEIVAGLVRHLVARGRLVRLPGELVIAAATIERVAAELAGSGWERFSVPQFKERFALSRKFAIPLLEHLDSKGVTRRVGDARQLVRREQSA